MTSSKILSVGPLIEKAIRNPRLRYNRCILSGSISIPVAERARRIGVVLPKGRSLDCVQRNLANLASFRLYTVSKVISHRGLLHKLMPFGRTYIGPRDRPGNLDESIEFMTRFTQIAFLGRFICLNTKFFVNSDIPAVFIFEKINGYISVQATDPKEVSFTNNDRVIMRLGIRAS